jgi:trk system potassium uptake protein TrkH
MGASRGRRFAPVGRADLLKLIIVVKARKDCCINRLNIKNSSPFKALLRNPPLLMTILYLLVEALGTALLSLPFATASGEGASLMEALFTATTSLCVTGLVTVTTATYWSLFGKIVILLLIQIGGLGIVTAAAGIAMTLNMRITMRSRLAIAAEKNAVTPGGMARLIRFVLGATFTIELVGAAILATRFVPAFGWKTGIWYSVFHSISAYCNAGIDILGDSSLVTWSSDIVVILAIAFLIILGGIGYPVYRDIISGRRWKKFRLHTKIVLATTAVLLIGGTFLFWVLERDNPGTLGNQTPGIQWLSAFLQSTTTRTAGFAGIPQGSLTHASSLLAIILMFIGGSPVGTAGGVKTTTLVSLLVNTRAEAIRRKETTIFNRRLPAEIARRAATIVLLSVLWCLAACFVITVTDPNVDVLGVTFEVMSAFGTVGLSRANTAIFSTGGQLVLIVTMLFGKLGPLTVLYALVTKQRFDSEFKQAEEHIMIG